VKIAPYIGCANKYPEKQEVDHRELIEKLCGYDGWALSCSSPSLKEILSYCPDNVRIGAWVKTFCSFKPNVNPAYSWEPVIFVPARGYQRKSMTYRDWVKGVITLEVGVVGAKPYYFCEWIFNILGASCDDDFHDLFPGSGAVTKAWENWSKCRDFTRWLKESKK
jgi:hypothetical protein